MKTKPTKPKHRNGPQVYRAKAGRGKGVWRARLWRSGRIIAESGEAYVNKKQAERWGADLHGALVLAMVWRAS